jgi:hypothetical protein
LKVFLAFFSPVYGFSRDRPKLLHLDVIEEIIGEEIVDETDRFESNMGRRVASRQSNAAIMKGLVNNLSPVFNVFIQFTLIRMAYGDCYLFLIFTNYRCA